MAISVSQSALAFSSASLPLWSATNTVPPVRVRPRFAYSSRMSPGSVGR